MATRDGAAWPWEGFGAPPSLAGVGAPPRRGAPALTLALAKPQPTATPYAKLFPVRIGVGGFRAAAAPSTKGKPLLQLAAPTPCASGASDGVARAASLSTLPASPDQSPPFGCDGDEVASMRRAAVAAVAAGCHPSRAATANAAAAAGAPRPPHPLLAALPSLLFPMRPRNEAGAGAWGEGGGEGLSPMPGCDFFDGGGADAAPPQAAVVDTRVEWTAGGDGSWVAVHRVTELVGGGGGGGGCPFDRRPAPYDLAAHPPPFGFDREE